MRITSKIDSKWVKEYIARMKSVDTAKLADIKKAEDDSVLEKERIMWTWRRLSKKKRVREMIRLKKLKEELWKEKK